jgi:hypothetical protein
MGDINLSCVLIEHIYLGVMQVVSFVEAETFFVRHGYALSLVTWLCQLHSFGSLAPCRK